MIITKKTGPSMDRANSCQTYATPKTFIDACEAKFGKIGFDLAADATNKKAVGFFSKEMDSLVMDWHLINQLCWLNPPYNRIDLWAKKCYRESLLGARILFLVPASVGSNWYRDFVHNKSDVYFLNGRITFEGQTQPYPKDCLLAHYCPPAGDWERPTAVWNWREAPTPSGDQDAPNWQADAKD